MGRGGLVGVGRMLIVLGTVRRICVWLVRAGLRLWRLMSRGMPELVSVDFLLMRIWCRCRGEHVGLSWAGRRVDGVVFGCGMQDLLYIVSGSLASRPTALDLGRFNLPVCDPMRGGVDAIAQRLLCAPL